MPKRDTWLRLKVQCDVYGDAAHLCLCTPEQFSDFLVERSGISTKIHSKALGHVEYRDGKDGGFDLFIWMPEFCWTVKDQETLAHELIHVTHFILKERGVDGGEGCGEAFAYLYSYFFRHFWMELKELMEKGKLCKPTQSQEKERPTKGRTRQGGGTKEKMSKKKSPRSRKKW